MASVYAGEHVVLNHRVAIKVLHEQYLENPRMERRFLNEARAIAAIRHPGIVQLFDIGRAPDGRAYIVMELLQGHSLRDRIAKGALPPAQTLAFGRQMAEAIAAAHAHDIIHRDLKPDNAFIIADPEVPMGERIKVLDFGVSKRMSLTPTPELTGIGITLGTPEYMSPEQANGDAIDERADIYSLGVVLYEMATGKLPFSSAPTDELMASHMYVQSKPARELNDAVSEELSNIIDQCLRKRRDDRFESMTALGDALAEAAGDLGDHDVTGPVSLLAIEGEVTTPDLAMFTTIEDEPSVRAETRQFFDVELAYEEIDDEEDGGTLDLSGASPSRWPVFAALGAAAAVVLFGAWLGLRSVDVQAAEPQEPTVAASELAPASAPAPATDPAPEPEAVVEAEADVEPAPVPEPTVEPVTEAPERAESKKQRAVAEREERSRKPEPRSRTKAKEAKVAKKRKPKAKKAKPDKKPEKNEDLFADVSTPTVF